MKMTKIVAISTFGLLISASVQANPSQQMTSQSQIEGSTAPKMAGVGAEHIHNVEGFGDFKHSHAGNSSAGHGHSWQQIQNEIKKRKMNQ